MLYADAFNHLALYKNGSHSPFTIILIAFSTSLLSHPVCGREKSHNWHVVLNACVINVDRNLLRMYTRCHITSTSWHEVSSRTTDLVTQKKETHRSANCNPSLFVQISRLTYQ